MARSKAVGASLLYMLIVLPIAVKVNKIIYSLFNFLSYVSKHFGQKCHSILLIFVKKAHKRGFQQTFCTNILPAASDLYPKVAAVFSGGSTRFTACVTIDPFPSDRVKQHTEELKQCAQNDENVKYGVHPLPALAQSIQNGADRVGNAAQQQK